MGTLANLDSTRHDRLFELIRQKHRAETTVAEVRGHRFRKISVDEMLQLQQAAQRSLQASAG